MGPKLLGIGGQKCGTTWLYEQLRQHPDIHFPLGKEVHFWDMRLHEGMTIDHYLSHYQTPGCGADITPAYSTLPKSQVARVHATLPQAKLVFMARHPVARSWSAAMGRVKHFKLNYTEVSDQWFINEMLSERHMLRGSYLRILDNWLAYYPADQLLVVPYDKITTQPEQVMRDLCQFLGIDPTPVMSMPSLRQRFNVSLEHEIRPVIQELLMTLYAKEWETFCQSYIVN